MRNVRGKSAHWCSCPSIEFAAGAHLPSIPRSLSSVFSTWLTSPVTIKSSFCDPKYLIYLPSTTRPRKIGSMHLKLLGSPPSTQGEQYAVNTKLRHSHSCHLNFACETCPGSVSLETKAIVSFASESRLTITIPLRSCIPRSERHG